jgi:hypothetical protein
MASLSTSCKTAWNGSGLVFGRLRDNNPASGRRLGPTLTMATNVLDTFKPAQIFLRCFLLVSDMSVIAQNLAIVCHCCLHFLSTEYKGSCQAEGLGFQLLPRPPTEHIQACWRDREDTKSPGVAHITIQTRRENSRRSVA